MATANDIDMKLAALDASMSNLAQRIQPPAATQAQVDAWGTHLDSAKNTVDSLAPVVTPPPVV